MCIREICILKLKKASVSLDIPCCSFFSRWLRFVPAACSSFWLRWAPLAMLASLLGPARTAPTTAVIDLETMCKTVRARPPRPTVCIASAPTEDGATAALDPQPTAVDRRSCSRSSRHSSTAIRTGHLLDRAAADLSSMYRAMQCSAAASTDNGATAVLCEHRSWSSPTPVL